MSKEKSGDSLPNTIKAKAFREKIEDSLKDFETDEERIKHLVDQVAQHRVEIASRDQKITDLLTTPETDDAVDVEAINDSMGKLREKVGELRAAEQGIAEKQRALNESLEKGIPVSLGVANASRFDDFLEEIDSLADDILKGRRTVLGDLSQVRNVRTDKGLSYSKLAKMSPTERNRLPRSYREKLIRGDE